MRVRPDRAWKRELGGGVSRRFDSHRTTAQHGRMETALAIALGLGLAAASGLRVFVPLLALSIAASRGYVEVANGWEWIGSWAALIALSTATVLEVAAYAVPWLDHALDVVATPAAVVAGMLASASVLVDMPPLLKWSIVIVGGGGLAGLTQGASVLARVKSGILTGGLANPIVSFGELAGAIVLSALSILVPIVALVAVAMVLVIVFVRAGRARFGRARMRSGANESSRLR